MPKSFTQKVYEITRQIPKGRVATYGQIAGLAGSPGAARAVGMCMKKNPDVPATPCHRVVASDGKLTGYSAKDGLKTKRDMLEEEGVKFSGQKVNLQISQWTNFPH
jgi:O-6-methylguanine DNA methyltransferase